MKIDILNNLKTSLRNQHPLNKENSLDLNFCEMIFDIGFKRNQEATHIILTIVTLFGKWSINNCRRIEKLSFLEFINVVKNEMSIYTNIHSKPIKKG